MKICGAILAGGKAARMGGVHKGLIVGPDGQPIVSRLAHEMLAAGAEEVVLVTSDPSAYATTGLRAIKDLRPGLGPLAGIEAALLYFSSRCDGTLFAPCDMPNIGRAEMRRLISVFEEETEKLVVAQNAELLLEPLFSVVHNSLAGTVSAALDAKRCKVGELWLELGARAVHFEEMRPFVNLNTQEDVTSWLHGKVAPPNG